MIDKVSVYLYGLLVLVSFPVLGASFNLMNNGSSEVAILFGAILALSTVFLLE